jgi:signal peptidase I
MGSGRGVETQIATAQPGPPTAAPQARRARRGIRRVLREMALVLLTALVVSLLVKTFLVQAFFIPSGSMEPTLHGCPGCTGDRVLVDKLTTRTGSIHRGDVVVFADPGGWLTRPVAETGLQGSLREALTFIGLAPSDTESDLIKRVIGVGGDTVEGRDGRVYVNGLRLLEPYVYPGDSPSIRDFKVTVPRGELWVMGDHRDASADSRAHPQSPGHGFVPVADVVGRAFAIAWPPSRAGLLGRPPTFDQQGLNGQR